MRPIPIPNGYAQALDPEAQQSVLGAPGTGDLTDDEVSPLEVVWFPQPIHGQPHVAARSLWIPTDGERARIAAGQLITLTLTANFHPPVALEVEPVFDPHAH
jgi:hypothetical protein